MNALDDTDRCDRCVAPYQVTVYALTDPSQLLRLCQHHYQANYAALAKAGWSTITGSREEILTGLAQSIR